MDSKYHLPLEQGWKRELVGRKQKFCKSKHPPTADAYYIHPSGKKFRSWTQINNYLTTTGNTQQLKQENFYFG